MSTFTPSNLRRAQQRQARRLSADEGISYLQALQRIQSEADSAAVEPPLPEPASAPDSSLAVGAVTRPRVQYTEEMRQKIMAMYPRIDTGGPTLPPAQQETHNGLGRGSKAYKGFGLSHSAFERLAGSDE